MLGCKLFGVYCLFLSLPYIAAAIPTFTATKELGEEYAQIMFLTKVVTWLIPIFYISLGVYLIKNGRMIHQFAYTEPNKNDGTGNRQKFTLYLKMLGMFLIINNFPDFLKSITSYFTYTNAPNIYDLFRERQYAYVNFIPSLGGLLFGLYLLKSGEYFVIIGLGKASNKEETEDLQ